MDIKDYLRIIRRRWMVILFVMGVTAAFSVLLQTKPVPQYRSDAEIIVAEPPMIVINTPGSRTPAVAQEFITAATNISLIRTREVLEYILYLNADLAGQMDPPLWKTPEEREKTMPVTDQEALEALLALPPADRAQEENRREEERLRSEIARKKSALTDTINRLKSWIAVDKERDSQIVRISATTFNQELSKIAATAVVEGFLAWSINQPQRRIRLTSERIVKEQRDPLAQEVGNLERNLATLREELRPPAAPSEEEVQARKDVEQLRTALASARDQREAIAQRREEIRRELQSGVLTGDAAAPAAAGENAHLQEAITLEQELARLLRTVTPLHPSARGLKDRIRAAEELGAREEEREGVRGITRLKFQRLAEIDSLLRKDRGLADFSARKERELADAQARVRKTGRPALTPEETVEKRRQEADLDGQLKTRRAELETINQHLSELALSRSTFTPHVQKVSEPRPAYSITPPRPSSLPMATLVGLALGLGAAYFLEILTTTIRTEHDIRRYVNLPLIGMILRIREQDQRLLINVAPKSPLSEVFNTIGTLFESYAAEYGARIFMVASSKAGEGKSTITANIATAIARGGRRVILIDCDLRKSVQHRFFNIDNSAGLSTLAGPGAEAGPAAAVPDVASALKQTEVEGLRVFPAGPHPQNPVSIIKSAQFKDILAQLREMADIVLIDVPPVNLAVDTMVLASLVDAVVLLVSAGETNRDEVTYAKRIVETARGKLIGCILNKVTAESHGYYYYYYYYDSYKYYREP